MKEGVIMDWLMGMNNVLDYIEENITESIDYDELAKMVCCSTYEFGRIFSFMAGVSISEYIRRRRLSLAAFDVQDEDQKMVDIALKYCYESPASFTRAFKEIHGTSPLLARKQGLSLKTYPKISFKLTIKGVEEMNFRIVKKDSFKIIGLKGMSSSIVEEGDTLDPLWRNFMDNYDIRLWNKGGENNYYHEPLWQVGAYWNESKNGETPCIIGAELGDKAVLDGMDIEIIPASTWTVFTITSPSGTAQDEVYARIQTEWFPTSRYKRNQSVQSLEIYLPGDGSSQNYQWQIWMPVIEK
jgi:AraC family transcriptional regulator